MTRDIPDGQRADATVAVVPTRRRSVSDPLAIIRLSLFLGWQDVRLMYRRSILGQFWFTLSMAVTFAAIGVVFGLIFKSPVVAYLPFLGCGLVFFTYMSSLLNDGSVSFITAQSFILQLPLPPIVHFLRTVWKITFILLHNAVALVILFLFFPQGFSWAPLLVIPGVFLGGAAMAGLALALAMLATRFRDVPQVVSSVVQVSFYLTPIIWLPTAIPEQARGLLLTWNPFYHLLQVMRQPLLNVYPTVTEWLTALGIAVLFVAIGTAAYQWKRRKLAFWV